MRLVQANFYGICCGGGVDELQRFNEVTFEVERRGVVEKSEVRILEGRRIF